MLRGDEYIADDPELNAERLRCRLLTERLNASSAAEPDARGQILRELLGAIGELTFIEPPFRCDYGYNIRIGARSFVNFGAVFLDVNTIEIGDDVQIAPNVQLLTATHPVDAAHRRAGGSRASRSAFATAPGWAAVPSCCRGSASVRRRSSARGRW